MQARFLRAPGVDGMVLLEPPSRDDHAEERVRHRPLVPVEEHIPVAGHEHVARMQVAVVHACRQAEPVQLGAERSQPWRQRAQPGVLGAHRADEPLEQTGQRRQPAVGGIRRRGAPLRAPRPPPAARRRAPASAPTGPDHRPRRAGFALSGHRRPAASSPRPVPPPARAAHAPVGPCASSRVSSGSVLRARAGWPLKYTSPPPVGAAAPPTTAGSSPSRHRRSARAAPRSRSRHSSRQRGCASRKLRRRLH